MAQVAVDGFDADLQMSGQFFFVGDALAQEGEDFVPARLNFVLLDIPCQRQFFRVAGDKYRCGGCFVLAAFFLSGFDV